MDDSKSESLRRNIWLGTVKDITDATQKRAALLSDLGMDDWLGDIEKVVKEKAIASLTESIDKSCAEMISVESEGKPFGVVALLKDEPDQPVRHVLALMVAKGLKSDNQFSTVGDLAGLVAGNDLSIALQVRSAFRNDGILREFVSFKPAESLDRFSGLRLREKSFNVMIGLAQDIQSEVISDFFRGGIR